MGHFKVVKQETKPIDGQKPGTSGLRKKVRTESLCMKPLWVVCKSICGVLVHTFCLFEWNGLSCLPPAIVPTPGLFNLYHVEPVVNSFIATMDFPRRL